MVVVTIVAQACPIRYESFVHPSSGTSYLWNIFVANFKSEKNCISLHATLLTPLEAADALGAFSFSSSLLRAMAVFVCRQLGHVMLMLVMTRFH